MPITFATSDTINLTNPTAGDANAGNGGDGTNSGDIFYNPVATLASTQTVDGADPTVVNGDTVGQGAAWGTGDANGGGLVQTPIATLAALTNSGAGGAGGNPTSSGDQTNSSGGNVVGMGADTTATQTNTLVADQHGTIIAGMGGAGGNGNAALGGDISAALVHSNPISETTTTTNTTAVSNVLDNFDNTLGNISDIGI
ncbi:PE-PGRS family protein (plasmid) [Sinorhizobium chiapasense]|uniref:PE-PGRS family protein n=1 Tax=Sinorhizobium chiapasense TaxID=501572 RepID=UPI002FE14F9C